MSFRVAFISNRAKMLTDQCSLFRAKLPRARARKNLSMESNGRSKWPGEVSVQEVIARPARLGFVGCAIDSS